MTRRVLLQWWYALSVIAGLGLVSARAAADEPVLVEHHDPTIFPDASARTTAIYAGAATTAGWYGAALAASYFWPNAPGASDLRIPVAGPWIALGNAGCEDGDLDCTTLLVVARVGLTAIDGIGQLGGLLVMAEGLFQPTAPTRQMAERRRRVARTTGFTLRPTAATTGHTWTLGVVGRF